MIVYGVEYEVKTPLIITGTKYGRIIEHSTDYLPGQTIRGALLYHFKGRGSKTADQEIVKPSIIFQPAYPVTPEGRVARPAHPLTYRCKVCGEIFIAGIPRSAEEIKPQLSCRNGHIYSVESIGGRLVYEGGDGGIAEYELRRVLIHSIGMNRVLRSSEMGMLYSYIGIAPGTRFRGLIVDSGGVFEKILGELGMHDRFEVRMGRRGSAGLGLVEVSVRTSERYESYIERRLKMLEKAEGAVYLLAKSPLFMLSVDPSGGLCSYIPCEELSRALGVGVRYVLKTGEAIASGFSLRSGTPKPRVRGLDIGSIIVLEDRDIDLVKALELELRGIGPFSHAGLNIVEVFRG